jgi:hypothetical protein
MPTYAIFSSQSTGQYPNLVWSDATRVESTTYQSLEGAKSKAKALADAKVNRENGYRVIHNTGGSTFKVVESVQGTGKFLFEAKSI